MRTRGSTHKDNTLCGGFRSALEEVAVDHLPSGRDELARAVQRRAAHGRAPCRRRQRNLWPGARADVEQRAWILARSLDQRESSPRLKKVERFDLAGDQCTMARKCKALLRVSRCRRHEMSKTTLTIAVFSSSNRSRRQWSVPTLAWRLSSPPHLPRPTLPPPQPLRPPPRRLPRPLSNSPAPLIRRRPRRCVLRVLRVRARPPHLLHAPARASTFLSGRAAPQRRPERLRVTGAALR